MAFKLLLADESITIRKVVTKVFSRDNFEVATVENHDDAISAARDFQPDVVILSSDLPGLDLNRGVASISNSAASKNIVILMGNRGDNLDETQSIKLGAQGFVYKPLDNRILKRVIEQLLIQPTIKAPAAKSTAETAKADSLSAETISAPDIPEFTAETIDQRAEILLDLFESYFNENMVVITDTMTKALAPRIAADISSRIIERLEITDLPKQIMAMTKGIVNDLVPQIAERVITREIESIKAEALRLLEAEEDDNDDDSV
ncbi:response regulator [bacterium]|nr:response regulator [candidate division CSSED10-310 bacterium]